MRIRFNAASAIVAMIFLATACTEQPAKPKAPSAGKEEKTVRRDFTKGTMTITYSDGTQSVSRIPIDSSAFQRQKQNSHVARISRDTSEEWTSEETAQP